MPASIRATSTTRKEAIELAELTDLVEQVIKLNRVYRGLTDKKEGEGLLDLIDDLETDVMSAIYSVGKHGPVAFGFAILGNDTVALKKLSKAKRTPATANKRSKRKAVRRGR